MGSGSSVEPGAAAGEAVSPGNQRGTSSVPVSPRTEEALGESPRSVRFKVPEVEIPGLPLSPRPSQPPEDPTKRRYLYLSGRFNTDKKFWYIQRIKDLLIAHDVPAFTCEPVPGKDLDTVTKEGLAAAKVLVAFCFEDYGERTFGLNYETFDELKYARAQKLKIIPVKLSGIYPPRPPGEGAQQNAEILRESLVYIDGMTKSLEQVEAEIRKCWFKFQSGRSSTDTPEDVHYIQRRHLYLSGYFKKEANYRYMRKVKNLLDSHNIPTFSCEPMPGEDYLDVTTEGLAAAKAVVAFCFENYGSPEHGFTYQELKYIAEKKLKMIPIKLHVDYPPQISNPFGKELIAQVFKDSLYSIDGRSLDEYDVSDELQRIWLKFSQDSQGMPEDAAGQRRHLYLSGRFNSDHKFWYIQRLKDLLDASGIPTFVSPSEDRGELPMHGLANSAALVAFCFEDYGECTGLGFDSFGELKYAFENNLRIIPIKLGHRYPPEPPDVKGRQQNAEIFQRILYIDGKKLDDREVVAEIRKLWLKS
ncbi:Uncharacterized protein SCF082_LOCUS34249 [Durusdinium trenchii]|uniref:TIR domain-containing protein n=1 Tax=Durusdinium trenchii TaxID=1381693 RepID=A0ABP0NWD0_9DINO